MSDPLRIIVVDDERLARDELCYQLKKLPEIKVVAQAENGIEALTLIEQHKPDLVFLDVQMPGLTGFEVTQHLLKQKQFMGIIFVTAYDQHAIEAFEVNAIDYLLKPIEINRLLKAVQRAKQRLQLEKTTQVNLLDNQLEHIVGLLSNKQGRRDQVAIRSDKRFLLIQAEEIIFASLADESINIVTGDITGISNCRTLDELQAKLDPEVFWRVHRSHLVNINKIKEIVPWVSRNYILRMKDEKVTEIPVSRSQTKKLREHLKL